jgi:hypothetical protein
MSAATPLPQLQLQTVAEARTADDRLAPIEVTLLELVRVVNEVADTEDEVVATVAYMIQRGSVRLRGNFRGEIIRLD